MAKMSEHGRVEQRGKEITILFKPEVPFLAVQDLVNSCAGGGCSCGCDQVLVDVDEIVTEDGPEGATVHLKGGKVKVQEVEQLFAQCDQPISLKEK
ncbi:MAG TPA: hypothetical protein VGK74_19895 [Symbiobacteriaceae bacterium]